MSCLLTWPHLFYVCTWVQILIPITRLKIHSPLVWYTGPLQLVASRNTVIDILVSSCECLAPLDYDVRCLTKHCALYQQFSDLPGCQNSSRFRRMSPRSDSDRIIFICRFKQNMYPIFTDNGSTAIVRNAEMLNQNDKDLKSSIKSSVWRIRYVWDALS